MLLVLSFNQKAPNMFKLMENHWPTLQINETIQKALTNTPTVSFRRTKNLRDIKVGNAIVNDKETTSHRQKWDMLTIL